MRKPISVNDIDRFPVALTCPKQAPASVHQQGGIVAAAHPGGRNGMLAKLLIKRGIWEDCDVTSDVDAFQALNGRFGPSWSRAKRLWIESRPA